MGRSPCCVKEGLKKGPWTQEEDQKLTAFVTEHGHGNWRSLPKKCGLLRCGKSCRLRWTNYLRPDIKRGLFTHSEEQKIIQLHSLVGNKWAFIASQLPKRTDNEIKNYWNTVLKKRLEKVGLLTLGTALTRTHSTLSTLAGERQRQDTKSINNVKSSASKKPSCNTSIRDMQSNACTHLAQWESARLEAEARLSKHSQSSKTHKLFSFSYMGHTFSTSNTSASTTTTAASSAFSSFPPSTTSITSAFPSPSHNTPTNPQSLQLLSNFLLNPPHTFPSSISNPCLIHDPPTLSYLSTTSSLSLPMNSLSSTSRLSLPAIVSMSSSCSASNTSSASSNIVSSKSLMSSLSSQDQSIASALTLVPSGRLSWQAKESCITPSPSISSTSQLAFISQMLGKIDRHHGHEVELNASTKGDLEPALLELKGIIRGNEQMSLEAATSSMMDLNGTIMEDSMDLNSTIMENSMDLNSTMDNWHDLIFDVENSCSDMVSTNWKDPIVLSSQREEFSHDHATSSSSTKLVTLECPHTAPQVPNVQDKYGSLDLEGLNLIQFDNLMSCEHYANQHSKELLWDTPTTLSVRSASIVN